jgi:hypothetical protein
MLVSGRTGSHLSGLRGAGRKRVAEKPRRVQQDRSGPGITAGFCLLREPCEHAPRLLKVETTVTAGTRLAHLDPLPLRDSLQGLPSRSDLGIVTQP